VASMHVVIVNYNAGAWLVRALNSALKFTAGSVSVVDNASSDNSIDQARLTFGEEKRLNWVMNPVNRGFAAANNQILAEANEDFVILLNPDCELNADTLKPILQAFKDHQEVALASCQIFNEDGTPQLTSKRRFPTPWSALVRLLKLNRWFPNNPRFSDFNYGDGLYTKGAPIEFVEAISGAFMVVRQSALATVGLLDEDYFMHCEDLDWCKRFAAADYKVAFVPQASVIHAKGISSSTQPVRVLWWLHLGMNRFFDKFYLAQTRWPMGVLVKLGIVISFSVRSLAAITVGFINKGR